MRAHVSLDLIEFMLDLPGSMTIVNVEQHDEVLVLDIASDSEVLPDSDVEFLYERVGDQVQLAGIAEVAHGGA